MPTSILENDNATANRTDKAVVCDASGSVLPLHPIYGKFWRSQEKGLLAEVQKAEVGSVRQMVANIFYLAAAHQVRLLNERDVALAMLPWGFYRDRANHIARQFDARLRTPNKKLRHDRRE